MCARLKTWITLSLAFHLAVLAWAAPGRLLPIPGGAPLARWDAVMVELPSLTKPPPLSGKETVKEVTGKEVSDEEVSDEEVSGKIAALPREAALPAPGEAASAPIRIVRNEEFARMSYIREMSAKTINYYRSAPKEFEGILRSAVPSSALQEEGSATVSIELSPAGYIGNVDIRSGLPALLAALQAVRWETAPLPTRYKIPCNKVELDISVTGKRLAVGMKIL